MRCLTNRGHNIDLQILNNEVSAEFKATNVDKWKVCTSSSLQTYIVAMLPSVPFKPLSSTSLPSLPVYLLPSTITFGSCSFPKLS
jgi:hypothetical protein